MSCAHKSLELYNAIDRMDRKLARKLILDEEIELTSVREQSLNILLRVAVESRDVALVRKLLQLIPHPNDTYVARILWIVVEDGDTEIASMLVRAGADVNMNSPYTPNFLHVLATSKDPRKLELAVLMMEHGANSAAEDIEGFSPLAYAMDNDNYNFAKEILKRNSTIEELDVQVAVIHPDTMKWLHMFVHVYPEEEVGRKDRVANIFYWLCEIDFVDLHKVSRCIDALLEIEVPDVDVIYNVILSGKKDLVKTILDSCRIDTATKMMLLHPAMTLNDTAMAELLIEWGADVNHRLETDVFPLPASVPPIMVACAVHSEDNIQLLLRSGAHMNVVDDYDNTPLSGIILGLEENESKLTVTSRMVLRHLALSTIEGNELKGSDPDIIHSDLGMLEYYEDCLQELRAMKRMKVLNSVVFYSIFHTDIKDLSVLTRRREFAKNCNRESLNSLFPLYFEELNWRLTEAEARRDILSQTENALYDSLGSILPDLVIDKITLNLYYSYINLKL